VSNGLIQSQAEQEVQSEGGDNQQCITEDRKTGTWRLKDVAGSAMKSNHGCDLSPQKNEK